MSFMKRTRYNPERRVWRGRSYRRGGKRIRVLRDRANFLLHEVQ